LASLITAHFLRNIGCCCFSVSYPKWHATNFEKNDMVAKCFEIYKKKSIYFENNKGYLAGIMSGEVAFHINGNTKNGT